MGIYLNPDNRMFQRALNAAFYVDKSELISFINRRMGLDSGFVAVSRPRRFGKSVDANMLCAYYSRGCDSRAQFEGLAVASDPSFEEHLNAHDVIRVDAQRLIGRGGGIENLVETFNRVVLRELRNAWPGAVPEDITDLVEALDYVYEAKGTGFVFVIDEWDCPMREAVDDEALQRRWLDFLRDLFKGAPYVDAAYMTGILPIKKYGKHSALNLFTEYSIVDPDVLAPLTGFNADEVMRLCERFGKDPKEVERWYDGYLIGPDRIHVYNPRSVAGAMESATCRSFWTSTETYEALQAYIDMDFDGVAQELVAMLDGQHVPVNVAHFENDMRTIRSKDDMYALLVHLGYLGYDQVERTAFIPNEEIRREFAVSVETGARPQLAALVRGSRELQRRTLEGDEAYVADAVRRAHDSAAGPHYYSDEQALRAAVKLAFIWSVDDYLQVDELGGGRGYADLAFIPKPGSKLPPMVVELKWDKPVGAAIDQIRERNYPAALASLAGECVLVGITYREGTDEHECRIERIAL